MYFIRCTGDSPAHPVIVLYKYTNGFVYVSTGFIYKTIDKISWGTVIFRCSAVSITCSLAVPIGRETTHAVKAVSGLAWAENFVDPATI